MKANSATAEELADSAPYVRAVGDCVRPRQAGQAMHEGFWAAVDLG